MTTTIDVDDTARFAARLQAAAEGERYAPNGVVVVPLLPLRQALLAVKAHAAPPKSELLALQSVRILPGDQDCHVVATDRITAALAAVPVEDNTMSELDPIDLAVDDVVKILAVFKMPADKDQWAEAFVRLTPHDNELTITDAGGLFDGQELTVPAHRATDYPDVPALIGSLLTSARASGTLPAQDRALGADTIPKLALATKTYDAHAYIQPTSADPKATHLVLVGPRFIGIASPVTPPDLTEASSTERDWVSPDAWRAAWAAALPRKAATA